MRVTIEDVADDSKLLRVCHPGQTHRLYPDFHASMVLEPRGNVAFIKGMIGKGQFTPADYQAVLATCRQLGFERVQYYRRVHRGDRLRLVDLAL